MIALTIRQPWATLIVQGAKTVENRTWATRHRGPFLVHAAAARCRQSYALASELTSRLGIILPDFDELVRGAIVGGAAIMDCVDASKDPWAMPFGYHFELGAAWEARRPMRATGKLGFWQADRWPKAKVSAR